MQNGPESQQCQSRDLRKAVSRFFKMAIDIIPAEFNLSWCIVNQRETALAAVGVAGELEVKWFGRTEFIEEVGFMHH